MSTEPAYDDRALTRYLLGQLAEPDADRLDELAIVDDVMAWRVRVVENELVDAYVRGLLDGENRHSFERHYLASPKRRAKVRFAERFVRAVDAYGSPAERPERRRGISPFAVPAGIPNGEPNGRRGWLDWEWLVASPARWGVAIGAAALLLVAASGVLMMRDLRMERELHEAEQQRATLDRRARELEDQLARQRAAAAAADARAALEEARAAAKHPIATVAVTLWPQTRNASAATPTVAVPTGIDRVTLTLQLDAPDFVRYSATLKESATGGTVWQGERLAASAPSPDKPPAVTVTIPANLLRPRAYLLELTGYREGTGESGDVIGSYVFLVAPR